MTSITAFEPEFHTAYRIDRVGNITHTPGHYLPTVEHSPASDILIDGIGLVSGPGPVTDWHALTGHTGQYGYRGAVMHASEQWGPWAVDHLTELADDDTLNAVLFAIVVVDAPHDSTSCDGSCDGDECDTYENERSVGWAVIYRGIPA